MIAFNIGRAAAGLGIIAGLCLGGGAVHAGVAVSGGGQATYSQAIAVPPGIAGMEPKLAFSYVEGGINGPQGVGWSVQGISSITRCPANRATDGAVRGVVFGPSDKLCLDGQRLIQTDAAGTPLSLALQTYDAQGLAAGAQREYRTEKDTFARIRAYGTANGTDINNGPAYLKVWTKSGQIYEYGTNPNANANALVNAQGKTVVAVWAVSRIGDSLGNAIDFKYEQRDPLWGSGPTAGSPLPGHEWNISEIQYSGNKVLFTYVDRAASTPHDSAEAYQLGSKNVSVRRLMSITTVINSPNVSTLGVGAAAVAVKTYKLVYDNGPLTQRSRVLSLQECAGAATSTNCLPASKFTYSSGGGEAIAASGAFNMLTNKLSSVDGKYGVLVGDFDGDGRTDVLRWSETGAENELWLSNGDGSFRKLANGSAAGQFNLAQQLFRANGCYSSMVLDVNGDGLPDIVRIASSTDVNGVSCGLPLQAEYFINNGTGGFTQRTLTLANSTPISFDRLVSKLRSRQYCGPIAALDADAATMGQIVIAALQTCRSGFGWTAGASYYFVDVNGDGLLDVLTSTLDAVIPEDPGSNSQTPPPQSFLPCSGCTKVYLANQQGTFDLKTDSNLNNFNIYADPGVGGDLQSFRRSVDLNGDGLVDLVGVGTPRRKQSWQSNGDGNFTSVDISSSCDIPIDFNADGRADCLSPAADATFNTLSTSDGTRLYKAAAAFNLKSPGQELSSKMALAVGLNYGVSIVDPTGDGRQGILRWHDDPAKNALYLSNGDGSFRTSTPFASSGPIQLKHSNGKFDFIAGDFTGNGATEFLRVAVDAPTATVAANRNQLYLPTSYGFPDILQTVTSPTGLVTQIFRTSLPNAGSRYANDRGDAVNKAAYPIVDITAPMRVVTTVVADTGVGPVTDLLFVGPQRAATTTTEYAYRGLKATYSGRGMLGFREVRQQNATANGQPQTVVTQYVQTHPYTGVAGLTRTYMGDLGLIGAQLLSQTTNAYCDKTSAVAPSAIATPGTAPPPCATVALLQRPYLYQTVEQGWDLTNPQLEVPRITTTNTFNNAGDPLVIVSTTAGTALGLSQTFTKTTTNTYLPDVTLADSWILGRLQRASVQSSVPYSLPGISTSSGYSPSATARQGTGQTQFATLSPISFGSITATSNAVQTSTLANTGALPLTITVPASGSVTGVGFAFASTTCGASLPAYSSCTVGTTFTPSAASAYTGTLSVVTGAGTLTANLSGTGIAPSVVYVPVSANWGVVGVASDSGDWPQIKNNTASSVLLTAHSTVSGPGGMWSWQGTTGYCIPGTTVLAPGASCQTFFGIGAAAIPGTYSATDQISFQVVGGNGVTFTVQQGYAFSLATTTPNPSSLVFGNVTVNTTSAVKTFTLTNNAVNGGSVKSLAISVVGGQPANFPMSHNCGTSLAAGASCTVAVSFNPTTIASGLGASVQITGGYSRIQGGVDSGYTPSNAGVNFTVPLSGTGAAEAPNISISPNTVGFGNQLDGATASATLTVANTGGPGTFSIAVGGEFSYTNGACPANGALLPANSTCTLTASFTGSAQCGGLLTTVRGTLTVSAGSSSANAALSGTHHVYKWTDPPCR